MRCENIMKKGPACVSPRDTVEDAARRMRAENIGFLPVCDQSNRVLGTVTDRDLALRVVADQKAPGTFIEDVMTHEIVSCAPEDELEIAEQRMAEHRKSRIMCLDRDGCLQGVISLSDVARFERGARASDTLREVSSREVHA